MKPFTPWAIALGSVALAGAGGVLEPGAARAGGVGAGFAAGSAACATPGVKAASDCDLRPCWCPDDYRPKPCPCFRVPRACGCCDDYCPKPAPSVRWPCAWPAFFKCPPPLPCGR